MLSFLKPFLIDKTLALNLSWLIAWVLQLPIRKVYKLEWVFFFIRPYSSRGIGIWSYVTKLHIERAKRVVKKAECFFQIENLRSLFHLWLTDIFLKKRVHDATDSNKVVKPLNCRTQSTVLLLINGGSECMHK